MDKIHPYKQYLGMQTDHIFYHFTSKKSKPDKCSKHAAVTGQPSKFNKTSLCRSVTFKLNDHGCIDKQRQNL